MSDEDKVVPAAAVENAERKEFLEFRNSLIQISSNQIDQFDKLVTTLSGGALALSVTFLTDISPDPDPDTHAFVAYAWGAFILSILFTLCSHLLSHWATEYEVEKLDKRHRNREQEYDPNNFYRLLVNIFNPCSAISFIVGVIYLVRFAYANLPSGGV